MAYYRFFPAVVIPCFVTEAGCQPVFDNCLPAVGGFVINGTLRYEPCRQRTMSVTSAGGEKLLFACSGAPAVLCDGDGSGPAPALCNEVGFLGCPEVFDVVFDAAFDFVYAACGSRTIGRVQGCAWDPTAGRPLGCREVAGAACANAPYVFGVEYLHDSLVLSCDYADELAVCPLVPGGGGVLGCQRTPMMRYYCGGPLPSDGGTLSLDAAGGLTIGCPFARRVTYCHNFSASAGAQDCIPVSQPHCPARGIAILPSGLTAVCCDARSLVLCGKKNPTVSPSAAPSVSPTDGPTTAPSAHPSLSPSVLPTDGPTTAPSAHPSLSPSVMPTRLPTVKKAATTSLPPHLSSAPTWSPSVVQPPALPTGAPATTGPSLAPSAQPTRSPSTPAPTLSPVAPVSVCASAPDGADCPGDAWKVTLDFCRGGECVHRTGAAAVNLVVYDSANSSLRLNTPALYTELGPLGQVGGDSCDGLLGVHAPGGGDPLFQERLQRPFNISSYHLSYAHSFAPARYVVGWHLQGQAKDGGDWFTLAEENSSSSVSHQLLVEGGVLVSMEGVNMVQSVRLFATAVRGDTPYNCHRVEALVVVAGAAAAAGCTCCLFWILISSGIGALCGFGAAVLRSAPRDPDIDAPWMGTEDFVQAKVLETYEELEQHWNAKAATAVAEAATGLIVPQDADPVQVLAAHAEGEWRGACSAEPQLRALPPTVLELLRRYSLEAQDIDRICGLPGAPKAFDCYREEDREHPKMAKAAWAGYKALCKKEHGKPSVNPALYSVINRCTRVAAEAGSTDADAWRTLDQLIKQTSLLIAATAHASDPPKAQAGMCGGEPQQRWLRMLSLPGVVRDHFARLRPGMCMGWSVAVASVTANTRASADFMAGGAGNCVLVRMRAPQSKARALALGPASLYGDEGELLLALGTMFRVRRVHKVRMLTRYVQPTSATPLGFKQLLAALRDPLLVVDVDWLSSPPQWCEAARRLCDAALLDAKAPAPGPAPPLVPTEGESFFQAPSATGRPRGSPPQRRGGRRRFVEPAPHIAWSGEARAATTGRARSPPQRRRDTGARTQAALGPLLPSSPPRGLSAAVPSARRSPAVHRVQSAAPRSGSRPPLRLDDIAHLLPSSKGQRAGRPAPEL
eukprot:TRINITY_DN3596_c0_g2_i1.p1 TRINITY_DN3596_c0_g2~~TRINITY_DN3596_c0_g2_i1.p1  ORF type:complete len:1176 (+),score=130.80 TRINITY_DN3596_c0_g2_i1:135-3530(+)